VRFYNRTWNECKGGFGKLCTEFWIGKSIKLNGNSGSSTQAILIVMRVAMIEISFAAGDKCGLCGYKCGL